jgi:hypothetical protein
VPRLLRDATPAHGAEDVRDLQGGAPHGAYGVAGVLQRTDDLAQGSVATWV